MKRNIVRYITMFIALCIFGYAAYELTLIYIESKESMDLKKDVSAMFIQKVEATENVELGTDESGETITLGNATSGVKFVWDYNKLLAYNAEAKGYIRQGDGEYIDNPILQHSDNDYYLNHLPNNTRSSVGSIFIDYRIPDGLEAKNCIIYGHMMSTRVNCIMFGSLRWYYQDQSYGLSHPVMDIYVGEDHYKYYVFSTYKTPAVGGDTYQYAFANDESFMNYVNSALQKSKYQFPEAGEILPTDKIVTLSTCTPESDDSKRLIVHLVRREKVDDDGNIIVEEETTPVPTEAQTEAPTEAPTQQTTEKPTEDATKESTTEPEDTETNPENTQETETTTSEEDVE